MPTEDILVMGSSLLDNASIGTNSGGTNGGNMMIHSGDMVFQSDDVIVITVENVTDGEVTGQSRIVGMVVYDTPADYVNGTPLYTYHPMNPGQYANIQSDISGLGDTYLRFNANVLVSSDGGPQINTILIAPGQDLSQLRPVIQIGHETDMDYDGDGVIDTQGDGNFNIDNNLIAEEIIHGAVCLTRGTLIDTPKGPRYIETLTEGDLINTLDAGPQPIRWIGSRKLAARGPLAPVLIRAGALGNLRDLCVSQNHRMLLRGPQAEVLFGERDVLVAAKHLVNDTTIRLKPGGTVEYFHMLFDAHHIIFAEGCPTESLYPGQQALNSVATDSRDEILSVFPELLCESRDPHLSRYELKAWEAQALKRAS
ncbi:Hint domain-containing protein [Celeribacter baekdonensis]|uniref:Hint domain-containing protein n=1 Tax=Celeribacter baekdonensis TaxID=875171 RepID=UPI0030DBA61A|tara:strand:+ start:107992 stop:109095 length:1104 start_codon:yes stop_codon:yes gene_type:complete